MKIISNYKTFVSLKVPEELKVINLKPGANLIEDLTDENVENLKKFYKNLEFEESEEKEELENNDTENSEESEEKEEDFWVETEKPKKGGKK